jgi:tRNA 2-thiouridine synthesizing protein E
MSKLKVNGKTYLLDDKGFLVHPREWDKQFAEAMASAVGIAAGLSREHWDVINLIRAVYERTGRCPLVYDTCRMIGLHLAQMERLFPAGYLRGACKLAGVTYREERWAETHWAPADSGDVPATRKTYDIDVRGFLVDPHQWDTSYAAQRAYDMKIPGGVLTDRHWRVIRYIRRTYSATGVVPTVYDTCEELDLSIEELEQLFPNGYHRGAVKIAGLRAR